MNATPHPAAPHHLPAFITAPGETDVLLVAMGIILIAAVLIVGNLFLRLHTLPERMAHKSQKLQFEIVAVLGLLALFTHQHVFWVAGLLLAIVDIPDFGGPLRRIAGSAEKLAGLAPGEGSTAAEEAERARLLAQDAQGKHGEPKTPAPRLVTQDDKPEEPKTHAPRLVGQDRHEGPKHEEPLTHA